jgi:hypothetical protein
VVFSGQQLHQIRVDASTCQRNMSMIGDFIDISLEPVDDGASPAFRNPMPVVRV